MLLCASLEFGRRYGLCLNICNCLDATANALGGAVQWNGLASAIGDAGSVKWEDLKRFVLQGRGLDTIRQIESANLFAELMTAGLELKAAGDALNGVTYSPGMCGKLNNYTAKLTNFMAEQVSWDDAQAFRASQRL